MTINSIKNNVQNDKASAKRTKAKESNITTTFMKSLFNIKERSNSRKKGSRCKKSNRRKTGRETFLDTFTNFAKRYADTPI